MDFVNVKEFQRDAALKFQEEGYYCDAPRGTKAYKDYWDEPRERCLNGYSVGRKKITGYHYY